VYAKSPTKPHTTAELLVDHLAATAGGALSLRDRLGRLACLPEPLRARFWSLVALAALTHDAGKIADGFQAMLTGGRRGWGQRHEVLSLGFLRSLVADPTDREWVALGVVTHHRPLTGAGVATLPLLQQYGGLTLAQFTEEIGPVDQRRAHALLRWCSTTAATLGLPANTAGEVSVDVVAHAHQLLGDILASWADRVDPETGLAAVLFQGAVTLADHLSSAHGTLHTTQPLRGGFRAALAQHWARQQRHLRPHQVQAADTDGHLLVRAATGSGKTEAGLLWAATQVEAIAATCGGTPRVFYTLPYLASINAMADRLSTLVNPDAVGVAHSRAASYHLAKAITATDDTTENTTAQREAAAATKALARAAATRLFRETVRVATPYQLLRGALAGPVHSSILLDAANSVFLLDELHAYDTRRLGFILAAMRFWEHLGGRIGILSATLPDALSEMIRHTLRQPVRVIDAHGQGVPARHRIRTRDHHLTDPACLQEITAALQRHEAVLVVANNVADAQHLYARLAPVGRQAHGADAAILLHSRFRRLDRARIESLIHARYRTGHDRQPGLVVATQVVEVSLDVDFDILYTCAATLEALLQRFGRVNRIAARPPAEVIVHAPAYRPRRGAIGVYADGIYPRPPVETAWEILTRHDGAIIDDDVTTGWLNEIYQTPWGQQWRQDALTHQDRFTTALLTFDRPFDDRADLSDTFDALFDGTEAILHDDLNAYTDALRQGNRRQGRLLAEEYLLPLPAYGARLSSYERRLGVRVVDADYNDNLGLLRPRGPAPTRYSPGEVL
jgi:CRISPR-associated endonuclease/helicase Cas3